VNTRPAFISCYLRLQLMSVQCSLLCRRNNPPATLPPSHPAPRPLLYAMVLKLDHLACFRLHC